MGRVLQRSLGIDPAMVPLETRFLVSMRSTPHTSAWATLLEASRCLLVCLGPALCCAANDTAAFNGFGTAC